MNVYSYIHNDVEVVYGSADDGYYFEVFAKEDGPSAFGYSEEPIRSHRQLDGGQLAGYLVVYQCPTPDHIRAAYQGEEF